MREIGEFTKNRLFLHKGTPICKAVNRHFDSMSNNGNAPNSQDDSQADSQIFAQVWEDDDSGGTFESVSVMELREEEDKSNRISQHIQISHTPMHLNFRTQNIVNTGF